MGVSNAIPNDISRTSNSSNNSSANLNQMTVTQQGTIINKTLPYNSSSDIYDSI